MIFTCHCVSHCVLCAPLAAGDRTSRPRYPSNESASAASHSSLFYVPINSCPARQPSMVYVLLAYAAVHSSYNSHTKCFMIRPNATHSPNTVVIYLHTLCAHFPVQCRVVGAPTFRATIDDWGSQRRNLGADGVERLHTSCLGH